MSWEIVDLGDFVVSLVGKSCDNDDEDCDVRYNGVVCVVTNLVLTVVVSCLITDLGACVGSLVDISCDGGAVNCCCNLEWSVLILELTCKGILVIVSLLSW